MTGFATTLQSFLLREVDGLRAELARYPDQATLWEIPPGLPNSGGTLALHLAGNLQHYIGARLGGTGYVRDRDREFSARDVPLAQIRREIDAAEAAIRQTFPRLTDEVLESDYPEVVSGTRIRTADFLVQVTVHLAYHLGQISYHRRLVTGDATGVGALSTAALSIARPVSVPPGT